MPKASKPRLSRDPKGKKKAVQMPKVVKKIAKPCAVQALPKKVKDGKGVKRGKKGKVGANAKAASRGKNGQHLKWWFKSHGSLSDKHTLIQWICDKDCENCFPDEGCNAIWITDASWARSVKTITFDIEAVRDICKTLKYEGRKVLVRCYTFKELKKSVEAQEAAPDTEDDSDGGAESIS